MRLATALLALLLLAGCASAPGGKTPRPDPYAGEPGSRARALREAGPTRIDPLPAPPSCVPPTRMVKRSPFSSGASRVTAGFSSINRS